MRLVHTLLAGIAGALAGCTTPVAGTDGTFSILSNSRVEAALSHGQPYEFALVEGFARRGQQSQRFEIRHGDCGGTPGWDDCANDRGRVERKEGPKNTFSRPGQGVWYGYSVYIPTDFVSLGRANTHLSQAKVEGEPFPIWQLTFNDNPYVLYSDGDTCNIGSMQHWRGGWNDITIYAHYGEGGQDAYFQLFRNGALLCQRKSPKSTHGRQTGRSCHCRQHQSPRWPESKTPKK